MSLSYEEEDTCYLCLSLLYANCLYDTPIHRRLNKDLSIHSGLNKEIYK
jgi:hypothetical protein